MRGALRVPQLAVTLGVLMVHIGALAEATGEAPFGDALTVPTTEGEDVQIPAVEMTATVLLFLSTDCPIANKYAPEIRRIQKRFEEEDVAFFRVYDATYQDENDIREHTGDYDYDMPAILDGTQLIIRRSGATVTPEAVVLDGKGAIIYRGRIDDRIVDFGRHRQHARNHDLIDAITAALKGEAPPSARTKAIGCFIPRPHDAEE